MVPPTQPTTQFATQLPPGPIDPGQQAIGLRPVTHYTIPHPVYVGVPVFTAVVPSPPIRVTEVALIQPLYTVAQVSNGVAIFGTGGGRAVTP